MQSSVIPFTYLNNRLTDYRQLNTVSSDLTEDKFLRSFAKTRLPQSVYFLNLLILSAAC